MTWRYWDLLSIQYMIYNIWYTVFLDYCRYAFIISPFHHVLTSSLKTDTWDSVGHSSETHSSVHISTGHTGPSAPTTAPSTLVTTEVTILIEYFFLKYVSSNDSHNTDGEPIVRSVIVSYLLQQVPQPQLARRFWKTCDWSGIRTRARRLVPETSALDHSAIQPC